MRKTKLQLVFNYSESSSHTVQEGKVLENCDLPDNSYLQLLQLVWWKRLVTLRAQLVTHEFTEKEHLNDLFLYIS